MNKLPTPNTKWGRLYYIISFDFFSAACLLAGGGGKKKGSTQAFGAPLFISLINDRQAISYEMFGGRGRGGVKKKIYIYIQLCVARRRVKLNWLATRPQRIPTAAATTNTIQIEHTERNRCCTLFIRLSRYFLRCSYYNFLKFAIYSSVKKKFFSSDKRVNLGKWYCLKK